MKKTIFLYASLCLLFSCINRDADRIIELNLSEVTDNDTQTTITDTSKQLRVAISAIISPRETYVYYKELLDYISLKLHRTIEFKQRKTYKEVNEMLGANHVDMAFICSGAYVEGKKEDIMELLAVPVRNGIPFYQAYIIVNRSSGIDNFRQLKNKSFAYTDPMSNTGRIYALKRLHELGYTSDEFFNYTVFTYAHDISIQLVSKQVIDGASVDGLIFDYLAKYRPDRVANLKIIEKSELFGIPPVVIPKNLDESLRLQLSNVLLTIDKDSTGKKILHKLMIDKFIIGNDFNYNSVRDMQKLLNE